MIPYTVLLDFPYGHAKKFLGLKNDPHTTGVIAATGEYSRAEVEVFAYFIRPDDVCIDAGALFGAHTVPMAMLCPQGSVLAFEPQRIPFQVMCANVLINSLGNVFARHAALGTTAGWVTMPVVDPAHDGDIYWGMNKAMPSEGSIGAVATVRIDSMNVPQLDFMKLDVEGHEPLVLMGGSIAIRKYRPVLYIEFHTNHKHIKDLILYGGYTKLYQHDLPAQPGTPMLLAVPDHRTVEDSWLEKMKFRSVC